jgi:hypothetical protein
MALITASYLLLRHVPPLALDAHAIVAVPHLPVGVG